MHVVVVTTSYPSFAGDSAGHFVQSEVEQLLGAGHRVTVLAPQGDRMAPGTAVPTASTDSAERETVVKIAAGDLFGAPGALARIRAAPFRLLHLPRFVFGVNRQLRSLRYDHLVAHWIVPTALPVCFTALSRPTEAQSRVPTAEIVVHGSDVRLLARLPRSVARTALMRWVRAGVRFRCVSSELRQILGAIHADVLPLTRVSPCAIAVPELPSRIQLRQELGLPEDALILICVGRLVASKRLDVALQVALKTKTERTKIVILVGDGPLRAALQERFKDVHFTGHVTRDLALRFIGAADVLLCASRLEGAPTVIREARALGTEVWCGPVGDVPLWAESDPGIVLKAVLA